MTRLGYLFFTAIVLSWVASLFLHSVPRLSEYWPFLDFGSILAAIVFTLLGLIRRRWNAFAMFSLLLAVLIVGDQVEFTYRTNNLCGPGDHIIRSDADAIKVAKARTLNAPYASSQYFASEPDLVDFGRTDACCEVTRTRTAFGVIVWQVSLHGETTGEMRARDVSAFVALSNCGVLFKDDSSVSAVPKKVDTIWPKVE
jgi:hypothetical protein